MRQGKLLCRNNANKSFVISLLVSVCENCHCCDFWVLLWLGAGFFLVSPRKGRLKALCVWLSCTNCDTNW